MVNMPPLFKTKRARAGFSVLAYAVSIAITFFTSGHEPTAAALVILAVIFNVYLFWPEIKLLKISYPKSATIESPAWLYMFGLVAIGTLVFAFFTFYQSIAHQPVLLTSQEFAQPYISGKYFKLSELADSKNEIEGRTFEDSYIYGPVVVWAHDNIDIQNCDFAGTKAQTFVTALEGKSGMGTGIIVLKDCKFRRCHFVNVSIISSPSDIKRWEADSTNVNTEEP